MQKAVTLPAAGDVGEIVDFIVELEESGWDSVFVWDHVQLFPDRELPWMDPWVLLGAVATATTRIRIGTMVTPITRRRPWKLAKEAITVDHLSGGRMILGVGLGAPEKEEFADFSEVTDLKQRAQRTDEGLALLDQLLRGGRVDHSGDHYEVHADLRPGDRQDPRMPIWIAATPPHRRPLERAKRWDGMFCNMVSTGLKPAPMTPAEIEDYAGDLLNRADFSVGTPRHPDHSIDDYAAVGVSWIRESTLPGPGWLPEFRENLRRQYG